MYLSHEPEHEERPAREEVARVARDGVQAEHEALRDDRLVRHYTILDMSCRRMKNNQGHLHHSSALFRWNSPFIFLAPQSAYPPNDKNQKRHAAHSRSDKRDVPPKLIRDAHPRTSKPSVPSALLPSKKKERENALEDILPRLKNKRALDRARVAVQRVLEAVRGEPRGDGELRLVGVARPRVVAHADAPVPQQERAVVQRPDRLLRRIPRRRRRQRGRARDGLAREEQCVLRSCP